MDHIELARLLKQLINAVYLQSISENDDEGTNLSDYWIEFVKVKFYADEEDQKSQDSQVNKISKFPQKGLVRQKLDDSK